MNVVPRAVATAKNARLAKVAIVVAAAAQRIKKARNATAPLNLRVRHRRSSLESALRALFFCNSGDRMGPRSVRIVEAERSFLWKSY